MQFNNTYYVCIICICNTCHNIYLNFYNNHFLMKAILNRCIGKTSKHKIVGSTFYSNLVIVVRSKFLMNNLSKITIFFMIKNA